LPEALQHDDMPVRREIRQATTRKVATGNNWPRAGNIDTDDARWPEVFAPQGLIICLRRLAAHYGPCPISPAVAIANAMAAGTARCAMRGKSRESIYGATVLALAEQAAHPRKASDRLACEAWNKRHAGLSWPGTAIPTLGTR
jgi:hypothetical protein